MNPALVNPSFRRTLPVEANIHPAVNPSQFNQAKSGFKESLAHVRSCSTEVFAQCPSAFRRSSGLHDSPLYAADAPSDRVCRRYACLLNRLSRPEVVSAGSTANSLDGDRAILFLRAPPRWTPGRFASLTARRVFRSTRIEKEAIKRNISAISGSFIRRQPEAVAVEISCEFSFASRFGVFVSRGRDIPRVPIES